MRAAFVFLAAAALAWAQELTVNTPSGVISCLNAQITWVGGTGPYTIQIQPGGDPSAAALETFPNIATSPYVWHVNQAANTQVFIRLRDSVGASKESGTFTIQGGAEAACASSSAAGSSSGAVTPPASSSAAPAPPAGSSSTPAVSTPAPGGSSSAGTGSTTASTTRASSTSASAAGVSAQLAVGAVAVVGGVVALLA